MPLSFVCRQTCKEMVQGQSGPYIFEKGCLVQSAEMGVLRTDICALIKSKEQKIFNIKRAFELKFGPNSKCRIEDS